MSASNFVFDPPPQPFVRVNGGGLFPVRRIFCIGRNYGDHVKEMGGDPRADPPVFFTKPADAVFESGQTMAFPPATNDLHYEGELVVALGGALNRQPSHAETRAALFGYAAGCDLTRRDLQAAAKKNGGPWDSGKGFDRSAPIGEISRSAPADGARLVLRVNGQVRQNAPLSDMIWSVPEIVSGLANLFDLRPGDLIFTGTPAGVGPLQPGDDINVEIEGLPCLEFSMGKTLE